MGFLIIVAYFIITLTLLSSERKWVSALGLILAIPFLLFMLAGLIMYLWKNFFEIAMSLLTVFVGGYIYISRKYMIDIILKEKSESFFTYGKEEHFCVDEFKKLMTSSGYNYEGMLQAYVGNRWNTEPFLRLLQGAIFEIINGDYSGEDRESLFTILCELEEKAVRKYYRSLFYFLPWGIKQKYNVYISSISVCTTIKVPLKEYRNMQYFLLKGKAMQREKVRENERNNA